MAIYEVLFHCLASQCIIGQYLKDMCIHSFSILSEQFVWGYKSLYVERVCCRKQNMLSCISYHSNMVWSKSAYWTRSSRETATMFKFVYWGHVRPYGKTGWTISKFGRTMSDDQLSFPALLQDGTFIGIYTLKWPTVFKKGSFFFQNSWQSFG